MQKIDKDLEYWARLVGVLQERGLEGRCPTHPNVAYVRDTEWRIIMGYSLHSYLVDGRIHLEVERVALGLPIVVLSKGNINTEDGSLHIEPGGDLKWVRYLKKIHEEI